MEVISNSTGVNISLGLALFIIIQVVAFVVAWMKLKSKQEVLINNVKENKDEIEKLRTELNYKASKDMVNAVETNIKAVLNEIKEQLKDMNKSIIQILSKK